MEPVLIYKGIYAESYWEQDYLGTVYQTYLDAIQNIEYSELSTEEKQDEVERAKATRLNALLNDGRTMRHIERLPPWIHQ